MIYVMPDGRTTAKQIDLTFDEAVERVPFLRALSRTERELLRAFADIRQVTQGRRLFSVGEPSREFLFLIRGHVKLMRARDDGREVILDVRGPGNLLCVGAVTTSAPYCCTALALDGGVSAIAFPRREINRVLENNAPVCALFVHQASHHEMRMADRVFELTSGYVGQRVSALLLRLADHVGVAGTDGAVRIPVKLSRQDLADLCGTTLESAIRTMTHLARENIVRTATRGFVIADRKRLEQLTRGPKA